MARREFQVPLPRQIPVDVATLSQALAAPEVAGQQRKADVFGTLAELPGQILAQRRAQSESTLANRLKEAQIKETEAQAEERKARAERFKRVSDTAQKEPSIFRQAIQNVIKNPLYPVSSSEEKTALIEQEIEILRQASESVRGVKKILPRVQEAVKPKPTAQSVLDKFKIK